MPGKNTLFDSGRSAWPGRHAPSAAARPTPSGCSGGVRPFTASGNKHSAPRKGVHDADLRRDRGRQGSLGSPAASPWPTIGQTVSCQSIARRSAAWSRRVTLWPRSAGPSRRDGSSLGVFLAADGGIVFLDEIGEMAAELQPKLLRVLQQHEVTPIGALAPGAINVQVIAVTNRDLQAEVSAGRFSRICSIG